MSKKSSSDHEAVLLIGGPDAGKSNFLFRLWIAIDAGQGALVKDGLPSELDYLSGGAGGCWKAGLRNTHPRKCTNGPLYR